MIIREGVVIHMYDFINAVLGSSSYPGDAGRLLILRVSIRNYFNMDGGYACLCGLITRGGLTLRDRGYFCTHLYIGTFRWAHVCYLESGRCFISGIVLVNRILVHLSSSSWYMYHH